MKAAVLPAARRIEISDLPVPAPGPDDIVVRVGACGVCGTDQHIFEGEHIVRFPVIPGHEMAGEVIAAGAEVRHVKVGDRVALDPNITCGHCFWCQRGEVHLCENLEALGVTRNGGFAEYCLSPAKQAVLLPDNVSLESGALAEPLACCLHGADRLAVRPGETVAILGGGYIGMILLQLVKAAGAGTVIVSEPFAPRREAARALGADILVDPLKEDLTAIVRDATDGVGVDAAIESAGRKETAEAAVALARRGGRVLFFGVVSPSAVAGIKPYDIYYKELTVMGSFVNPFTHARAVQMLSEGKVQVECLISHRFPVDQFAAALETARSADAVKVIVEP
ncbi:MAG TPA: zinc-dependent alcohol dehydrogenase family protein [Armatimonadota bacterium]